MRSALDFGTNDMTPEAAVWKSAAHMIVFAVATTSFFVIGARIIFFGIPTSLSHMIVRSQTAGAVISSEFNESILGTTDTFGLIPVEEWLQ